MISAPRTRFLAFQLFALGVASVPVFAQEVCPRASGPDAEAGWVAYAANDIDVAKVRFDAALARCPNDYYARTGLGYVALREGVDSVAVRHWTVVITAVPDQVDALTGLGLAAWRRSDVDAVRAHLTRVLELNPGNATALEYLGRFVLAGAPPMRPPLVVPDTLVYPARTNVDRFEVRGPVGWTPFYIKGVNLGAALPGKHPSEFPDSATYARWLRQMSEMNANVVRVYTIHPPHFYQALQDWNARNPANRLWLIHGVWTEPPPKSDFAAPAFESEFFDEMRRVVDLLHGRADVQPRPGHAAGYYTADVSAWTLAYIIGREWEPFSALAFDSIRGGQGGFEGRYLTVRGGNAMDAWMARAAEELVAYETETYRAQRPIAYTNWPTLDPLAHPTEATVDEEMAIRRALGEAPRVRDREYDNDALSLDAMLVSPTSRLPAGYFASFHAYPYYPDFMLLEQAYQGSVSSLGRSNFFGYLQALKAHHAGIPVVISEYGVPASLGIGHLQPQGWHHGGLTEQEAAAANHRLTLDIAEAGMAGGALFAWIDEWFKHNWVTIEFELPADRTRLWHNRLDAEQHYGVMALEAVAPVSGSTLQERLLAWAAVEPLYAEPGLRLRAAHDESYLWLLVETPSASPEDTVLVGFDVIDPLAGDFQWPERAGERLPLGLEFVLRATGPEVRVLADPPSNPFRLVEVAGGASGLEGQKIDVVDPPLGLFHARVEQRINLPFYSVPNDDGRYDSLRVVVNRRRLARDSTEFLAVGYDRGLLPGGGPPDGFWERAGDVLEVRIPWLLLNVTDPSSRTVLHGPGGANARGAELGSDGVWRLAGGATWPDSIFGVLGTRVIEGIGVVAAVRGGGGETRAPRAGSAAVRYSWPTWEAPEWTARARPTFESMRALFERLDPYGVGTARPTTETRRTPGPSDIQVDPANEAYLSGNTELALRLYEERLAQDPNDGVALHRVALMRAWSGAFDAADELFEHLLEVEPANLDARVDRARVWAWSGDTDRALDAVADVLDQAPDHAGALEARALFEAWGGRYEASLSTYDQLLAIAPDNSTARRQQAQVLAWASRFDASRAAYDSLLARNPNDVDARLGLAGALAFANDLDGAVAEYDRVLMTDPNHVPALQGKGRALGWANRLVESEATLRRAVSLNAENVASLVGLATILQWQGRTAAALEILREAERLDPTNGEMREQLRGVDLALSPVARPSFVWEDDSDDNLMFTTGLSASFHITPRLDARVDVYRRILEQGALERTALGGIVVASYQLEPGWALSVGAGASDSDAAASARAAYHLGVRSPARHPVQAGLVFAGSALDATAALSDRGVTTKGATLDARWTPSPLWRVDAAAGLTRFQGSADNDRASGLLAVSRQLGGDFAVGSTVRAFSFDSDLADGYFDPDFYGIGEINTRWLLDRRKWSFLYEMGVGFQQVGSSGDLDGVWRTSSRLAYKVGPGRELSLAFGTSSTGLQSYSTGATDYRYMALVSGASWVF